MTFPNSHQIVKVFNSLCVSAPLRDIELAKILRSKEKNELSYEIVLVTDSHINKYDFGPNNLRNIGIINISPNYPNFIDTYNRVISSPINAQPISARKRFGIHKQFFFQTKMKVYYENTTIWRLNL
jgi:hypothetical protein